MQIPDEALNCVVFLCAPSTTASGPSADLRGTGFFVAIPEAAPNTGGWVYLVTAKHVSVQLPVPFVIRANAVGGGGVFVEWNAGSWWTHPDDPFVDVAVLPWAPIEPIAYDYVPTPMFALDTGALRVGAEIFATGLFAYAAGAVQNQPIVRTGHIAMVP